MLEEKNYMMLWYTPGPASAGLEEDILGVGADGVRLTFSFSTPEYQQERARYHKRVARRLHQDVTCVADLAGEKFRLGLFSGSPSWEVSADEQLRLVSGLESNPDVDGTVSVTNPEFFRGLAARDLITVGDGSVSLVVEFVDKNSCTAILRATSQGVLNQGRGLTVQGHDYRPRCLTDKDWSDLSFVAKSAAFNMVALSFVADADDVKQARSVLSSSSDALPIVAKIETQLGIENVDSIAAEADVLMAARGDLGLAIPWVELPGAVDRIASAADAAGKPWILATQVAEGLERFIIPTRAEICDLAHWARRGAAGVLVSYETAFGARPVEAVSAVRSLIERWSESGRI